MAKKLSYSYRVRATYKICGAQFKTKILTSYWKKQDKTPFFLLWSLSYLSWCLFYLLFNVPASRGILSWHLWPSPTSWHARQMLSNLSHACLQTPGKGQKMAAIMGQEQWCPGEVGRWPDVRKPASWGMFQCPIGHHLHDTNPSIKLLRISSWQPQGIKPQEQGTIFM